MNAAPPDSKNQRSVGIVSGSGLDLLPLIDEVDQVVSFAECDGLIPTRVAGHPGTFTFGRADATPLVLQSGRLHFYEGLDYRTIARPVDFMYERGVRSIILTNVSGSLLPNLNSGNIVAVDRILTWPFVGWSERPDTIAPDWVIPGASSVGTYVWMHGPSYETPAEIRVLQKWGGSVVGMSTAPEVQRCRQLGIRCAVLSCVTNNCCTEQALTHEEVVASARSVSEKLRALIHAAIERGDDR